MRAGGSLLSLYRLLGEHYVRDGMGKAAEADTALRTVEREERGRLMYCYYVHRLEELTSNKMWHLILILIAAFKLNGHSKTLSCLALFVMKQY